MSPRSVRRSTRLLTLSMALWAPGAAAQSLFVMQVDVPIDAKGEPDPSAHLRGASLFYIEPPKPREFAVHDLVTIIVEETTRSEANQSLDTKKEYDIGAAMNQFPSLRHLLELQVQNGDTQRTANLDVNFNSDFKGEGDYARTDRFVARITAAVIDVKPNGTVVVEARKRIDKDGEIQTIILSGVCRREDVTAQNTVLSSQLADLTVSMSTEGEVTKAGRKGVIPRALEAVFNF
ncbi:flagellar basal body L-ring protein FlgH [Nodularia spumigena]|uniref:flagellar basal body L-ring protein FlgH n=1 Tax=Nodularia spumigena TaxID=70799 RepID=UPI002B215D7C|nr:flagellar basal body L-ring protein FlgH [Nodularia spumigena]MEA5557602.1 flagellar basal body L-ring protein FlgH [Nodularia spumigena CH309]